MILSGFRIRPCMTLLFVLHPALYSCYSASNVQSLRKPDGMGVKLQEDNFTSASLCKCPASTRTSLKREFPAALPRWNCYLQALQILQRLQTSNPSDGLQVSNQSWWQSPWPRSASSEQRRPQPLASARVMSKGTVKQLSHIQARSKQVISQQHLQKKINRVQAKTWVYASTFLRRISLARKPVPSILCTQNFQEPWSKQENPQNLRVKTTLGLGVAPKWLSILRWFLSQQQYPL